MIVHYCGGKMIFLRMVSVGPIEVELYECEKCGKECDQTDYEDYKEIE